MITKFSQLNLSKKYTYADYLTWQFKERVELFKGWVMKMSPAPSTKHQRIVGHIYGEIYGFLKKEKCEIFMAPFDVRLTNKVKSTADNKVTTVVQPDICIICNANKVDEKGCLGAPDLIIEVLSKGNTTMELETKYKLYEENGVREYWIVQQGDETVAVFDLVNNKFVLRQLYSNTSIVPIGIFKNKKIDMTDVFIQ